MLTRIFGDRLFVAVAKLLGLSLLVGLALTAIVGPLPARSWAKPAKSWSLLIVSSRERLDQTTPTVVRFASSNAMR